MNPQMLRRFRYRERKEPASPLDYAGLMRDVEYQNVLRHMSFAVGFKDRQYRRLAAVARDLSARIREELASRG